mmetsp:Transcript_68609/g.200761  ORF Transcript_68609/g.200761 Transcript_68609/m.200761 type:complete len:215 (+) Transcript_68609:213-857(+)
MSTASWPMCGGASQSGARRPMTSTQPRSSCAWPGTGACPCSSWPPSTSAGATWGTPATSRCLPSCSRMRTSGSRIRPGTRTGSTSPFSQTMSASMAARPSRCMRIGSAPWQRPWLRTWAAPSSRSKWVSALLVSFATPPTSSPSGSFAASAPSSAGTPTRWPASPRRPGRRAAATTRRPGTRGATTTGRAAPPSGRLVTPVTTASSSWIGTSHL